MKLPTLIRLGIACGIAPSAWAAADDGFLNPPPDSTQISQAQQFWGTEYHIEKASQDDSGYALLDRNGASLGASLAYEDWCNAALEGTVAVADEDGINQIFNVEDKVAEQTQVDCYDLFPTLPDAVRIKIGKTRFRIPNGTYGDGYDGLTLVPYRTIAVDIAALPLRQLIYIPEARGTTVILPGGEKRIHDGYFFTADKGSAIKVDHLDFFIATADANPFAFARGPSTHFTGYLIDNPELRIQLLQEHAGAVGKPKK